MAIIAKQIPPQAQSVLEDTRGVFSQSVKPFFSKRIVLLNDLAPGEISNEILITESEEWEGAPFDTIFATHLGNADVEILMDRNPENTIPVKAGFQVSANQQEFRNFRIQNIHATNTLAKSVLSPRSTGDLIIIIQNTLKPRRI